MRFPQFLQCQLTRFWQSTPPDSLQNWRRSIGALKPRYPFNAGRRFVQRARFPKGGPLVYEHAKQAQSRGGFGLGAAKLSIAPAFGGVHLKSVRITPLCQYAAGLVLCPSPAQLIKNLPRRKSVQSSRGRSRRKAAKNSHYQRYGPENGAFLGERLAISPRIEAPRQTRLQIAASLLFGGLADVGYSTARRRAANFQFVPWQFRL